MPLFATTEAHRLLTCRANTLPFAATAWLADNLVTVRRRAPLYIFVSPDVDILQDVSVDLELFV